MMHIVYYVQILELYNFASVLEELDPDDPKLAHFSGKVGLINAANMYVMNTFSLGMMYLYDA
jgi:hypothetical protein